MTKYVEREAVLSKLRNHYPKPDDMIASVVTIPAADVVEVVRCHECVHHVGCGYYFCNMWCANCPDDSDFFCAYGERMENETEV